MEFGPESDPDGAQAHPPLPSHAFPHNHTLSRQSSSLRSGLKSLSHQPSRLDLIDDTTLTSLPLPPPPSRSRKRTNTVESDHPSLHRDAAIPNVEYVCLSVASGVPEYVEDESFFDEDESEDPIVLVEDYMRTGSAYTTTATTAAGIRSSGAGPAAVRSTSAGSTESASSSKHSSIGSGSATANQHLLQRKQSLAHFKSRLQLQQQQQQLEHDSESISDSSTTTSVVDPLWSSRTSGSARAAGAKSSSTLENLEEVFGKIPGTDNLKYCDLCDKPLYEISAIIRKRQDTHCPRTATTNTDTTPPPVADENGGDSAAAADAAAVKYEEFVCEECIEHYEQFFNELEELQTEQDLNELERRCRNDKICEIFKSIERKYSADGRSASASNTNKRGIEDSGDDESKRTKFSKNLLDRLHTLSGEEASGSAAAGLRGTWERLRGSVDAGSDSDAPARHDTPEYEWLRSIQNKLRWRWRFHGLLPEAITKQHSIK